MILQNINKSLDTNNNFIDIVYSSFKNIFNWKSNLYYFMINIIYFFGINKIK